MQYYVHVIEKKTGRIEREMGPMSELRADRVAADVSINLDHDRFKVIVKESKRGEKR